MLRRDDLGAWLFQANPRRNPLPPTVTTRCVAPSYRAALMRPGDPVLLWLSGPSSGRGPTPGIWGVGELTAPTSPGDDGRPVAHLLLEVADEVLLPREVLRADAELSGMEVLRMPAGSNPCWVTRREWELLAGQLPPAR